jgi:uncharacterized protein YgbK (DUF1537 family)
LARQTTRAIELLDVLALTGANPEERLNKVVAKRPAAILFDGLDEQTLRTTGHLLWTRRPKAHSFAVGSSGLIHALAKYWRESAVVPHSYQVERAKPVDRLVIVSGSCSPITAGQIGWALANGYTGIRLDTGKYDDSGPINEALQALSRGESVVFYTALGAVDRDSDGGEKLGSRLGALLREVLARSGVRRAVVAGGDTSSYAVRQLGIEALTFAGLTSPGAPLCRCHGGAGELDGLELVLKGGQVGPENFFEMVGKPNI